MKLLAGLSLFLALTVGAFAEPFVDTQNGFTIEPANGWVKKDRNPNMPYAALTLQTGEESIDERGLFYVDVFDQDAGAPTLDAYVTRMKNYITNQMGGQVLTETQTTVNDLPAVKLTYTGVAKEYTNRNDKYMRLVVRGQNGKFYVLHGVAQRDHFDAHEGAMERMASSFHFGTP